MVSSRYLQQVKKIDKSSVNVISFASYTVIYALKDKKWKREDIEGSLFLTERESEPGRRLIVANRVGLDNMVEDIDNDFVFELNKDYIFFQNKNGVKGIWFGKSKEKLALYTALSNTASKVTPTKVTKKKTLKFTELSKASFKAILLELLDNDDFIETLHRKYLNRVRD